MILLHPLNFNGKKCRCKLENVWPHNFFQIILGDKWTKKMFEGQCSRAILPKVRYIKQALWAYKRVLWPKMFEKHCTLYMHKHITNPKTSFGKNSGFSLTWWFFLHLRPWSLFAHPVYLHPSELAVREAHFVKCCSLRLVCFNQASPPPYPSLLTCNCPPLCKW